MSKPATKFRKHTENQHPNPQHISKHIYSISICNVERALTCHECGNDSHEHQDGVVADLRKGVCVGDTPPANLQAPAGQNGLREQKAEEDVVIRCAHTICHQGTVVVVPGVSVSFSSSSCMYMHILREHTLECNAHKQSSVWIAGVL